MKSFLLTVGILISGLFVSCVSTPKEPIEIFGSNLDSVEQYISSKYNQVFETDFLTPNEKIGFAMNGSLSIENNKVFFKGTEPHSILFLFNSISYGKVSYIRFKPITGKWYSISIESGEYQTPSFTGLSLMQNEEKNYVIAVNKGSSRIEKSWSRRQYNFRNIEYLVMFEIDFDGKRTVRIFNEKGQYNTYNSTDLVEDIEASLLFKVQNGSAEMVRYKELEY